MGTLSWVQGAAQKMHLEREMSKAAGKEGAVCKYEAYRCASSYLGWESGFT